MTQSEWIQVAVILLVLGVTVNCQVPPCSNTRGKYCCGTKLYDPNKQLCCDRQVFPKPSSSSRCCGRIVYDTRKHVCCYGRLISISFPHGTRPRCCGPDAIYNPSTHLCCSRRVIPKPSPSATRCCGDVGYDPRKQLCCGQRLYSISYSCCGSIGFNPATHQCCPDRRVRRKGCCFHSNVKPPPGC